MTLDSTRDSLSLKMQFLRSIKHSCRIVCTCINTGIPGIHRTVALIGLLEIACDTMLEGQVKNTFICQKRNPDFLVLTQSTLLFIGPSRHKLGRLYLPKREDKNHKEYKTFVAPFSIRRQNYHQGKSLFSQKKAVA